MTWCDLIFKDKRYRIFNGSKSIHIFSNLIKMTFIVALNDQEKYAVSLSSKLNVRRNKYHNQSQEFK